MYRVELKVAFLLLTEKAPTHVPNVPCGVESDKG